jgi:hypothetical protein
VRVSQKQGTIWEENPDGQFRMSSKEVEIYLLELDKQSF